MMTLKPITKSLASVMTILSVIMVGCTALVPAPTPTLAATSAATAIPTATKTFTPEPSPTVTVPAVPTSSISDQPALAMSSECRAVIDGLYNLKKDLGFPDHLTEGRPFRQGKDFDPNQYFNILTHLEPTAGYKLDFLYFTDELASLPLVYVRKSGSAPFQSYAEFLKSFGEEIRGERSYKQLRHKFDYLEKIVIDQSPESYFEFVTLAILGDQFYLSGQALYKDSKILCDISDQQYVDADMQDFGIEFPQDVKARIGEMDLSPAVVVDANTVTVRFVTFTKWGGFFENVYVMDKKNPMQVRDTEFNPLIEYDCRIVF